MEHQSEALAIDGDTVRLPGFVRIAAGIYSNIDKNWKAQLTVENLFDTNYWATADADNNISPAQGHTVRD